MVPLGKLSIAAAVLLLLIQCLSRADAEDAVTLSASPPTSAAGDILGDSTKDPVAEEARRREDEARANASQAIDALNRWLVEEMKSGRYTDRSLDIQQWIGDLNKVKQAIDEGKPLDEANRMAKELENEILRQEKEEAKTRQESGDCKHEAKTLPEGEEKEDEKENVHSKLVRGVGKLRSILELAELVMNLTSCSQ